MIQYNALLEDAAYGRNGQMHQAGLDVFQHGPHVSLRAVTSRGETSSAARLTIPMDAIDAVVATLLAMKSRLIPAGA